MISILFFKIPRWNFNTFFSHHLFDLLFTTSTKTYLFSQITLDFHYSFIFVSRFKNYNKIVLCCDIA